MTTIHNLPDKLLLEMFQELSVQEVVSCSQVCRAWYTLAQDDLLWKHLFVRDFVLAKVVPGEDRPDDDDRELTSSSDEEGKPDHQKRFFGLPTEGLLYWWHRRMDQKEKGETVTSLKKTVTKRDEVTSWKSEYIRLVDRVPKHKVQVIENSRDMVQHVAITRDGKDIAISDRNANVRIFRLQPDTKKYKFHQAVSVGNSDWLWSWESFYSPNDRQLLITNNLSRWAVFERDDDDEGGLYTLKCALKEEDRPGDTKNLGHWVDDDYFVHGYDKEDEGIHHFGLFGFGKPLKDVSGSSGNASFLEELRKRMGLADENTTLAAFKTTVAVTNPEDPEGSIEWDNFNPRVFSRPIKGTRRHLSPHEAAMRRAKMSQNKKSVWTNDAELDVLKSKVADRDIFLTYSTAKGHRFNPDMQVFKNISASFDCSIDDDDDDVTVVDMGGSVSGVRLSQDQRHLFAAVRELLPKERPTRDKPRPKKPLHVKIVDLDSFTILSKVYSGVQGMSIREDYSIYPDSTADWVACGSSGCAIIWDRHLQLPISYLKGFRGCVNCVTFNPAADGEMCLTGSDDHNNRVAIWWSSRMLRESGRSAAAIPGPSTTKKPVLGPSPPKKPKSS